MLLLAIENINGLGSDNDEGNVNPSIVTEEEHNGSKDQIGLSVKKQKKYGIP